MNAEIETLQSYCAARQLSAADTAKLTDEESGYVLSDLVACHTDEQERGDTLQDLQSRLNLPKPVAKRLVRPVAAAEEAAAAGAATAGLAAAAAAGGLISPPASLKKAKVVTPTPIVADRFKLPPTDTNDGVITKATIDPDGTVILACGDNREESFDTIEDAGKAIATFACSQHSAPDLAAGMKGELEAMMQQQKVRGVGTAEGRLFSTSPPHHDHATPRSTKRFWVCSAGSRKAEPRRPSATP